MKLRAFLTWIAWAPVLSLAAAAVGAEAGAVRSKSDLDVLVGSERAFCRLAAEAGIRPAFLKYLAPQAVVFRPRPVNGRDWYTQRGDIAGRLAWEPEFADVAHAGDLGYTTGPWEFREKAEDPEPGACGHYVSLWGKQPDGAWLVLIDVGNTHARHDRPVSMGREVATGGEGATTPQQDPNHDGRADKETLLSADRAFSDLSASKGALDAYLRYAAEEIRLYRPDALPSVGRQAMKPGLPDKPALFTWKPSEGGLSRSGDLGFTYGIAELRSDAAGHSLQEFSYLRIWRRHTGGEWLVALDLLNRIPPPDAGSGG